MGAMAEHFGEDKENWEAIGYLHDYDYQEYPEEHLRHTKNELLEAGVSEEEVRAILSHGYGIVNDVEPETNLEKSLFYRRRAYRDHSGLRQDAPQWYNRP